LSKEHEVSTELLAWITQEFVWFVHLSHLCLRAAPHLSG
jgi:hypothetical protein